MKLPCAVFLCLAVFAIRARAQEAGGDPRGGTLVDCDAGKVAILAHSESSDGRYAVGWTVRPDRNKTPVDWSSYDRNNPSVWMAKYPTDDNPASGEYALVNGVLDLRAGKFTPLVTGDPFWPQKNHAAFGVVWSGDDHGTRSALVNNDARWSTTNLWLVVIGPARVRATDLAVDAARAVAGSIRKRTRQSAKYETTFVTARSVFKGKLLKVHFDAEIPKGSDPGYEGTVAVAVPDGTIKGVTSRLSD